MGTPSTDWPGLDRLQTWFDWLEWMQETMRGDFGRPAPTIGEGGGPFRLLREALDEIFGVKAIVGNTRATMWMASRQEDIRLLCDPPLLLQLQISLPLVQVPARSVYLVPAVDLYLWASQMIARFLLTYKIGWNPPNTNSRGSCEKHRMHLTTSCWTDFQGWFSLVAGTVQEVYSDPVRAYRDSPWIRGFPTAPPRVLDSYTREQVHDDVLRRLFGVPKG